MNSLYQMQAAQGAAFDGGLGGGLGGLLGQQSSSALQRATMEASMLVDSANFRGVSYESVKHEYDIKAMRSAVDSWLEDWDK